MVDRTFAELMARLQSGARDAETQLFEAYLHRVLGAVQKGLRRKPKVAVGANAAA